MRLYYRGATPPKAGDWVNFQSKMRGAICGGEHFVEQVRGTSDQCQVWFRNREGVLQYKQVSSVVFIGTQQECAEAFRKSMSLSRDIETELHEINVKHGVWMDNLKMTLVRTP